MDMQALTSPGAQRSEAAGARGTVSFGRPSPSVPSLPTDRVTLSTAPRVGASAEAPAHLGSGRGDGMAAPADWSAQRARALDSLPMVGARAGLGPGAKVGPEPEHAAGEGELRGSALLGQDGSTTPPTVSDRLRAAARARHTRDWVPASARSRGLDSPTDAAAARDEVGAGPAANAATAEQQVLLEALRQRDRDVRAHEAAHMAAGGALAGAATYTYEQGPDGRSYAVGGEVPIDLSPGANPQETIDRARRVRQAALAPVDPSGQDLQVAAAAAALELRAEHELLREQQASREVHQRSATAKAMVAYQAVA